MVTQSKISFAREATRSNWKHFPELQEISKIDHFGIQNLFKIRPRNERPMVPKVVPMGRRAEPKIRQKVKQIVSERPFESGVGKNYVSDRLKH